MIHLTSMETTIVGKIPVDRIVRAWKYSRPHAKSHPGSKELLKNDLPVLEAASFSIEVVAPIYIREIITSSRCSIWARGSRSENTDVWRIWSCEDQKRIHKLFSLNKAYQNRVTDQDNRRMALPLDVMMPFTWNTNVREAIKFGFRFIKSDHTALRVFGGILLGNLSKDLDCDVEDLRALEDDKALFRSYAYPNSSSVFIWESDGAYSSSAGQVKIGLYCQLVRHRDWRVITDIQEFLRRDKIVTLDDKIDVGVLALTADIEAVAQKRRCWIAQTEIWDPIFKHFGKEFTLPCDKKGLCPYLADNQLRITGEDPNPPCPRAPSFGAPALEGEQVEPIEKYIKARPQKEFWLDELEKNFWLEGIK